MVYTQQEEGADGAAVVVRVGKWVDDPAHATYRSWPISDAESGICTELPQPPKLKSPTATPCEELPASLSWPRDSVLEKAPTPMLVTVDGTSSLDNNSQLLNAFMPMLVGPSAMVISVMPMHPWNA